MLNGLCAWDEQECFVHKGYFLTIILQIGITVNITKYVNVIKVYDY